MEAEAWRIKHEADYRRSWVTIAGLHFLDAGTQSAGSAPSNDIVLGGGGPAVLGRFTLDGTTYKLKSSTSGDNVRDLVATYTVNLSAEARNGTWKLRVTDVFAGDTGYVDSWTLTV